MKKKILFSFITLCIFFLIIELLFRVIFYVKYHEYNTTLSIQGNTLQMADDTLIFRNRPYYLDNDKRYQFNIEGFKSKAGDTEMPVKGPSDFWVFVFGASAMEGMGSNKDGEWIDIAGVPDHSYVESPAFLLQQQLQLRIPDRKVRVFCAANSGFTIFQSELQYNRLKRKYNMDWVISLDGNNEPLIDDPKRSVKNYLQDAWKNYPIFKAPLKYIVPITKRSAFVNTLKQVLFEMKINKRVAKAARNNFPARSQWLSKDSGKLIYDSASPTLTRTIDSFFYYLHVFDKELDVDNVPHILFIQPHLTMRDMSKSSDTEKALLNYYKSTTHNNGVFNVFIRRAHEKALTMGDSSAIQSLDFMHANTFETFVDYCHFSNQAIQELASFFADKIASQYYSKKRS